MERLLVAAEFQVDGAVFRALDEGKHVTELHACHVGLVDFPQHVPDRDLAGLRRRQPRDQLRDHEMATVDLPTLMQRVFLQEHAYPTLPRRLVLVHCSQARKLLAHLCSTILLLPQPYLELANLPLEILRSRLRHRQRSADGLHLSLRVGLLLVGSCDLVE